MAATDIVAWWGAITGTAGTGLAAWRVWWDRGAPSRAIQRGVRDQLREVLTEIVEELEQLNTALRSGKDIGEAGEGMTSAFAQIKRLHYRLDSPHGELVELLAHRIDLTAVKWRAVHKRQTSPVEGIDTDRKVRADEADLKEFASGTLKACREELTKLTALDRAP